MNSFSSYKKKTEFYWMDVVLIVACMLSILAGALMFFRQ